MDRIANWALGIAWLLTLSGCGSVPLDPEAPTGFDLNGHWVINRALSDPPPNERRLQAEADRALVDMGRMGQRRRMGMLAFVTADFPVLASKSMIIEQDPRSMGIRYANGAYRDVSWGERRRGLWEVNAGWTEEGLVIASRADDASATETMRLRNGGRQLAITIDIKSAGDALSAVRVFDRVSGN
ncbi:MAG: hypothetical protein OXU70_14885 [Gammaproteobacteria bacterium]|nr:hypothetical protein [Gammaproteobacteria bacterium]